MIGCKLLNPAVEIKSATKDLVRQRIQSKDRLAISLSLVDYIFNPNLAESPEFYPQDAIIVVSALSEATGLVELPRFINLRKNEVRKEAKIALRGQHQFTP